MIQPQRHEYSFSFSIGNNLINAQHWAATYEKGSNGFLSLDFLPASRFGIFFIHGKRKT